MSLMDKFSERHLKRMEKKAIKKGASVDDLQEIKIAMKYKVDHIARCNGMMFKMLQASWVELRKQGVTNIDIKYKNREFKINFKQQLKEFFELIKDGEITV